MRNLFIFLAVIGCTALSAQKIQKSDLELFTGHVQMNNKLAPEVFHQELNGQNGFGVAYLTAFEGGIYLADDFEVANTSTITKIIGYGFQSSSAPFKLENITTHLNVLIYEGDDDSPSQTPADANKTITLPLGPHTRLVKDSNYYTLEIDLESLGLSFELVGNKRYWISILPTTTDTGGNSRWAWFKSTTQEFPGEVSLIDPEDLFDNGYTDWILLNDILTSPWDNFGLAFTLEGNTLGISEVVIDKSISIYPNPASNKLNIELVGGQTIKTISIQDFTGKTLISTKSSTEVDVQALPKGTYLVTIETNQGKKITKKFIKK